jgi:AMP nucleosidase
MGANVRSLVWERVAPAITANGFRFRVPYGTLLCVSDKPLHGEIKFAGMAGEFYRQRRPASRDRPEDAGKAC